MGGHTMKALYRALWGFLAFIPFCWLWGVQNFTWFSLVGTLYFIPVHWLFDRIIEKKSVEKKDDIKYHPGEEETLKSLGFKKWGEL